MLVRADRYRTTGLSLIEMLIAIAVLAIGALSLAAVFPVGLMQVRSGVFDARATLAARNALERISLVDLLAQPLGPPAVPSSGGPGPVSCFTEYPAWLSSWSAMPGKPTFGPGLPVVIDPLWMLDDDSRGAVYFDTFGMFDSNNDGLPDVADAAGILRVRGGSYVVPAVGQLRGMLRRIFLRFYCSPDDLTFGEREEMRMLPMQTAPGGGPPWLVPTFGEAFAPGTLYREQRFTWIIVARKVSAAQAYSYGANGTLGSVVADGDDILEDRGPDLQVGTSDDPAWDLLTGAPTPAPIGPFDVTVVVYHRRDFSSREAVFANTTGNPIFVTGRPVAILERASRSIPFPNIKVNSIIMDTTCNPATLQVNAYVYKVVSKELDLSGLRMILTLDRPAVAVGNALTVLHDAVAAFSSRVR